jgi:hypothetical protein
MSNQKIDYKIEESSVNGVLVYDNVSMFKESPMHIREFPFLLVNEWNEDKF